MIRPAIRSICALFLATLAFGCIGCSIRYSPDDLRGDAGGAEQPDGGADAAAGSQADAGPSDAAAPDAASVVDAAAECEIPGEDCGDEEFVECTEELTCEPCGRRDEPCCREGPQCTGLAGIVCTGVICL